MVYDDRYFTIYINRFLYPRHDSGHYTVFTLKDKIDRETSIYSHLLMLTGVVALLLHESFSNNSCSIIG